MIPASAIARLAALGLSPEQVSAVAEIMSEVEAATEAKASAALEHRRASDRERKARQRHGMSRDITGHHGTSRDIQDLPPPSSPLSSSPPHPPNNYPLTNPPPTADADHASARDPDFGRWVRTLVGDEPCLVGTDEHTLEALLDSGEVTRADIETGIRTALAKAEPGFRFRSFRSFAGWVRGAAKDRIAAKPRAPPATSTSQQSRRIALANDLLAQLNDRSR